MNFDVVNVTNDKLRLNFCSLAKGSCHTNVWLRGLFTSENYYSKRNWIVTLRSFLYKVGKPLRLKNYCSNGIHFATAKFHFNEHIFFYTRTKRKSSTNVTDFVRTFNRLIIITIFVSSSFCSGAKVCAKQILFVLQNLVSL